MVLSVEHKTYESADQARAKFETSLLKDLHIDAGSPAVTAAFDAWYREVEPLLAPQPIKQEAPRLDPTLLAGRAEVNLMRALLESGLSDRARTEILARRSWICPRVAEKTAEKTGE
jgi:hypothetical protein